MGETLDVKMNGALYTQKPSGQWTVIGGSPLMFNITLQASLMNVTFVNSPPQCETHVPISQSLALATLKEKMVSEMKSQPK